MMISSRYIKQDFHVYLLFIMSGARWNFLGALISPKSIRLSRYVAAWMKNVPLSLSSSTKDICLFLQLASKCWKFGGVS